MAINDINVKGAWNAITYGFKLGVPQAIDDRLVLTKEQMRNISDDRMPEVYLAVCSEDNMLYIYQKYNSSWSTETGKFVKFKNEEESLPLVVKDGLLCCRYKA